MNKIKHIVLYTGVLMLFAVGCEFGGENLDPNNQTDVALKNILPAAITQAAYNQAASPARLSGIFMQHFSGFDAQQIDYEKYIVNETTLNNFWNFGLYTGVMKDAVVMIEKGQSEEDPQPYYVGIGKVLMANALGYGTSVFGDMPYLEAFQGVENTKPVYDTQESVYNSIQILLDEAITELSKPAVPGGPAGDDLIYGGDAAKWILTARALKARYYMHLTKRDASAASNALGQISGSYTSTADQSDFVFDAAIAFANPLALFGDGRPNTLVFNEGFEARLADNSDPRKDKYTKLGAGAWLFYTGDPADGLFWANNDSPMPLISYTEIKFLEAEALVRTGGTGANAVLQEAIASNMDYLEIDAADRDAYLGGVANIDGLSEADAIKVIIEESYVALYGQAEPEVWANFRRTGHPAITPNSLGVNANNPSGVVPRRVPYPQNEKTTNEEMLNQAISRQGPDLADTDVWAFQ
ncbi:MAG: SusD/RagB family nutrient-binding outer membrane lipoprotein [Cyclobacteriaceae bacterium]